MNIEIKSVVILLITLLLGVALGVLGTGILVQQKVNDLKYSYQAPEKRLMEFIEPTNEQREQLQPILDELRQQIRSERNKHRDNIEQIRQSAFLKLQPILTDRQYQRLQQRHQQLEQRREQEQRIRKKRKNY